MQNKLLSPDTLKDEYHTAYEKAINSWAYRGDILKILGELRQSEPSIYMDLATLAHDYGRDAMRLGVRVFFDAKGIE